MRLEDIHKKVVQDEKPPNDHLDLQSVSALLLFQSGS